MFFTCRSLIASSDSLRHTLLNSRVAKAVGQIVQDSERVQKAMSDTILEDHYHRLAESLKKTEREAGGMGDSLFSLFEPRAHER